MAGYGENDVLTDLPGRAQLLADIMGCHIRRNGDELAGENSRALSENVVSTAFVSSAFARGAVIAKVVMGATIPSIRRYRRGSRRATRTKNEMGSRRFPVHIGPISTSQTPGRPHCSGGAARHGTTGSVIDHFRSAGPALTLLASECLNAPDP